MWCDAKGILILLYFIAVNIFTFFINYFEYFDIFTIYSYKTTYFKEDVYDYIIVGAGSAGSIVAKRLAENKNHKILLLEAGKNRNFFMDIPSVGLMLQKTTFDWQYETVPQENACIALNNNKSVWPLGKIVGGTSMLNNLMYLRGHPEDFRYWFQNKSNYDYNLDILPYFKKLEYSKDLSPTGSAYIGDIKFSSILPDFVKSAAKYLGYEILKSNMNCQKGFMQHKVNIKNGKRFTASHNLFSQNKMNLILETQATVQQVLFKDNFEAYGVKYEKGGNLYKVRASKGVILSAGVLGTPQILMRSGIGHKNHLEELEIKHRIELPVGDNLQDHVTTGFDLLLLNQTVGMSIGKMLSPVSIFEYLYNDSGPWTTTGCELCGFLNTEGQDVPDLQLMVMPLGISEDRGFYLRKLIGISDFIYENYFRHLDDEISVTILPVLLHPKSRGTVRLKDNKLSSKPIINPRYLTYEQDIEILYRGIEIIKRIIYSEPMQKLGTRLNTNIFPGCEKYKFDSKKYWYCYIKQLTVTAYHPVGTCKMSEDETGVVNYNFEVKNTNKLYVVDGSVLPNLTSGNINGAVMMMAEMASDVIKNVNFLKHGKSNLFELFLRRKICCIF